MLRMSLASLIVSFDNESPFRLLSKWSRSMTGNPHLRIKMESNTLKSFRGSHQISNCCTRGEECLVQLS